MEVHVTAINRGVRLEIDIEPTIRRCKIHKIETGIFIRLRDIHSRISFAEKSGTLAFDVDFRYVERVFQIIPSMIEIIELRMLRIEIDVEISAIV